MNKQLFITILLTVLMSMSMYAYDFKKDGICYNIEGDHVSVTNNSGSVYQGSITIPNEVTYNGVTYPVTSIAEHAFDGGRNITFLFIPRCITNIGENAFFNCGSINEVRIDYLSAWCKVHFGNEYSCPLSCAEKVSFYWDEVKSVFIPDDVESIPNFAFYRCRSITSLFIPSSVKKIGSSAFEDCTGLTVVQMAEGVEKIGGSSFEGCTGLSSIVLPSSVKSIALNAFNKCNNLNTIISRIKTPFSFDESAFCVYSFCKLFVPENTKSAYLSKTGWKKFANITDDPSKDPTRRSIHVATAGTLPNLISTVEKYQIEELTLTGEINGIDLAFLREMAGKEAFYEDEDGIYNKLELAQFRNSGGVLKVLDMSDVNIVSGGNYITIRNTYSTLSYTVLTASSNEIPDYLFIKCNSLKSITIPNSVTSIGKCAFGECDILSSISIPNCVKSIGNGTFHMTAWYDNQPNGVVYAGKLAYSYKGEMPANSHISIKDGTLVVNQSCFRGFKNLTSITIPNSVESIGESAFYGCSGLTSITISNSNVTSIGSFAFYDCKNLTSINLPNSVTSVGESAFQKCSGLTTIHIPNSVTSVGREAFHGTAWYNNQPDGLVYAGKIIYKYKGEMPTDTQITIKEGTVGISVYAFSGCTELTSVIIPNNVTTIGSYAFSDCTGLASVVIPCSVTSIGSNAFWNCSGLTSIMVDSGNKNYDSRKDCNAIIETSSNKLMVGCMNTVIPNSVTSIGDYAFQNCSGLSLITIPNSVESIGSNAFYGCCGLTNVVSKIENPFEIGNVFYSYPNDIYATATLFVPAGKKSAYEAKGGWNRFTNIKEIIDGDVNLDEKVNRDDRNALVAYIMGEKPEEFYEGLADLNGDDNVDAADVVTLVDILNNSGLSTDSQFDFDNVDGSLVVSSLICTLNNKRNEAIQLTKCELYCKGNLVSYKNFSDSSVTAGGSKECSFNNLTKHAASTSDFTVCWHYTVNGEAFVYRCPLTD